MQKACKHTFSSKTTIAGKIGIYCPRCKYKLQVQHYRNDVDDHVCMNKRWISKAGVYLKPCLVEVAHAAIKDKTTCYYTNKLTKISKRQGKERAIIAIARKILVAIYNILKTGELFNPSDIVDVETPIKKTEIYQKQFKSNS